MVSTSAMLKQTQIIQNPLKCLVIISFDYYEIRTLYVHL